MKVIMFFPAVQFGGIAAIKALAAPYTDIRFMPTGGINADNLGKYLSYDRIVACGGSWMVRADLIRNREFDEVKRLTAEAVGLVAEIRNK